MRMRVVIHPFLFALYPVVEWFLKVSLTNSGVSPNVMVRPSIVLTVGSGVCMLIIWLRTRDWDRAAYITTLILFAGLYYGSVSWQFAQVGILSGTGNHQVTYLAVWVLVMLALGGGWLWRRLSKPELVTNFLNVMAVVAVVLSVGQYALKCAASEEISFEAASSYVDSSQGDVHLQGETRPDIYYIILDGYARADVLEGLYDHNNTEFLDFLRSRDFYVAAEARSNYIQTALSLSSSLNMSYLRGLPPDLLDRQPLAGLLRDSEVRRLLSDHGYQMIAVNSGYQPTEFVDADVYLSPDHQSPLTEFEELLVLGTAAAVLVDSQFLEIGASGYDAHRELVVYGFQQLAEVPALPGPKFVFFHIVSPHPPFVFADDGTAVVPPRPYSGLADGSHFDGSSGQYIAGYQSKLVYTNAQIEHAIDVILTASSEPPVIILQADHGPGAYLDWDSSGGTCLWERTSILSAYHLPSGTQTDLYPSITPVNSFRVVFDAVFGTAFGLLEDRTYYSTWHYPYDFEDVTERSQVPCIVPEVATFGEY